MPATLSLPTAHPALAQQPSVAGSSSVAHDGPTDMWVDSSALLQGQKSVSIVHNGATYRLQTTKLGKLILTK